MIGLNVPLGVTGPFVLVITVGSRLVTLLLRLPLFRLVLLVVVGSTSCLLVRLRWILPLLVVTMLTTRKITVLSMVLRGAIGRGTSSGSMVVGRNSFRLLMNGKKCILGVRTLHVSVRGIPRLFVGKKFRKNTVRVIGAFRRTIGRVGRILC